MRDVPSEDPLLLPMRATDKKRFRDLGRQLREIRVLAELTTGELANEVNRGQPWISEIERGTRHLDVFDFVRLSRALALNSDEAITLLESVVDDSSLDDKSPTKGPKVRPKLGPRKRRV